MAEGGMHARLKGMHGREAFVVGGMHGRVACVCVGGMCGGHAWQRGTHGRGTCMAGEMATAVGGTHPAGMHSCLPM